jgi:hypothetical protein
MAVKHFSRIPLDVWAAVTACVIILLIASDAFTPIFVGTYAMLCAYVLARTFTKD